MIFRILLGIYLTFHFSQLISYAEELFGSDMPYDYKLAPTYKILPNVLDYINASYFVILLTVVSVMFTFELYPRICAFVLWYGWAALFNRNPLIHNPGVPYVGWILLALMFVEDKPNKVVFNTTNWFLKRIQKDSLPKRVFWSGWILLAAGYTASGLHKLVTSPSWVDGTALQYVLESCLARDNLFRNLLVQFPNFLKFSTWMSLFLEISFLPLGVFYYTRGIYWLSYIALHLGILMLINFTDLTIGVLMIHLFTFDWDWTLSINDYISDKIKRKRELRYGSQKKTE